MEKTLAERFAARLEEIMQSQGISRVQLSKLAGMSRGNVTRHLSGVHAPSGATLEKLAKLLKVDPCDLLCDAKKKK